MLPEMRVFLNGRFCAAAEAAVSVFDHGLLYGDGVFEGIRAYNGRVFKLERHVARLFESARAIRLEIPYTPHEIAGIVVDTCRTNGITDGYIRLVVTRGAGDLGLDPRTCARPSVVAIAKPSLALYARASSGVRLVTSALRRHAPDTVSPSIKSLNYLNNVLARIEANDHGADEALLLDAQGYVSEATADNVFIVTGEGLSTPPTATNLRGVTRETVFELAADLGIAARDARFTLFDVWTAGEVFICGTGAEIVPVITVDGRTIGNGAIGEVTARIVEAYHALVRREGTPIPPLEPQAVGAGR